MATDTLILKEFNEAVVIDRDNEILLGYELDAFGEIDYSTEGRLVEVCSEMASEIEGWFGIRVCDYGVLVRDVEFDFNESWNID